jgi:fibronectin-binding autotransporter adhesin
LSLALGLSGNFDVAGTATIGSGVSGGFGLTKTGVGTLTFSGSSSYTGSTTVSAGTLVYGSGSSASGGSTLTVGTLSSGTAAVAISTAGALSFTGLTIGSVTGSVGTVSQTSGTTTVNGTSNIGIAGSGSYILSGSGILAATATFNVGGTIGGALEQDGGTSSATSYYQIGNSGNSTAAPGVATFNGGVANLVTSTGQLFVGNLGAGVMNVGTEAGGNAVVTVGGTGNTGPMEFGVRGNTIPGYLNLDAGTLKLVTSSGASGAYGGSTSTVEGINLDGGTLQAGSSSTLLNSVPNVFVYRGGAIIDTQGFTSTITSSLQAAGGNGVYASSGIISTNGATPGGTAISGLPVVTVSGGSGSGITANAVVSGGAVTGFVITNPGQNYASTDTLTFTLTGGGASPSSTFTTPALGSSIVLANTGGLTKLGSGTLVLTTSNTYAGATSVNAGTLRVTGSITGTGAVTVASGATLGGTGTVAGPVTVSGTITGGASNAATGTFNTSGGETWNPGGALLAKFTYSGSTVTSDKLIMSGLNVSALGSGSGDTFGINLANLSSGSVTPSAPIVLADDTDKTSSNPFDPAMAPTTLAELTLTTSGLGAPAGYSLELATEPDGTGGYALIVVAPEPTSLLLAGLAAGPLCLGRRRRKESLVAASY